MGKQNVMMEKSVEFSYLIINLYKILSGEKGEYILSKQILRSATSIGANIYEAQYAESRIDFAHKLRIALKETHETLYWLLLLYHGTYIPEKTFVSLEYNCRELLKLLISSINTLKQRQSIK